MMGSKWVVLHKQDYDGQDWWDCYVVVAGDDIDGTFRFALESPKEAQALARLLTDYDVPSARMERFDREDEVRAKQREEEDAR